MKHVPERTCICCRKKFPKNELLRIVRNGSDFSVDETSKSDGRGAYFCGSEECKNKLIKSRALNRAFKQEVKSDVYEDVLNFFDKNSNV